MSVGGKRPVTGCSRLTLEPKKGVGRMTKGRMEAFSDGVFAVIITIMVLEMKSPQGTGLAALQPLLPVFFSYVLSFVYVGIYWNNHHHLLQAAKHVTGGILWANLRSEERRVGKEC